MAQDDKNEDIKVYSYPSEEAIEWSDRLEDGWFKDKDVYIHEVYKYYWTLGSEFIMNFDNFIMRYTHWVIEETKKSNNLK